MQTNQSNERNVVIYARVSSKEQEREGFSIPAQLELLRNYAKTQGMVIVREFVDIESASVGGRTGFGEMIAFLKKSQNQCRTILVEKTDRLYRNIHDYSTVDEFGVTIHFVKEGSTLSPNSRSSEQFIHGIKVLMARNYSQNLGEETLKGMVQKAKSGLYPSCAPAGYRNVEGRNNKRTIVPNADAPTITRLFDVFATGKYSLKELAAKARADGWTIRGRRLHKSTLHQILRKRIYSGDFDWDGVTYKGTHQAIVSPETWQTVQTLLDHRVKTKQHRIKRDFAFTGLVRCGHCGCALVGEVKKGKYVYYHCTSHKGKCPEPYTREEAMQDQFGTILRELVIPPGVLDWLQEAVVETDLNERGARDREIERLEEQHRRVQTKLEAIYEDRLEGRISTALYDRKAHDLRTHSLDLLGRMNEMRKSAPAPIQDAIDLMDLISRAADLFLMQPTHEKQRFLKLVLKSAIWQDGRLRSEFEDPFESLRRSNRLSRTKQQENGAHGAEIQDWLLR
jgi:DNA invertase Pin-like site-specific DNA recombinase